MRTISTFFFTVICVALVSCKTGQQTAGSTDQGINPNNTATSTIETPNSTLSLVDYLRKIPGIQVTGSGSNPDIRVRNAVTLNEGDASPLFVIDNTPVGNNYYSVASMIDVNDIKSITVLKDVASTSSYGIRGANGVIVIHMKKGPE